jgi:hypothetical protein
MKLENLNNDELMRLSRTNTGRRCDTQVMLDSFLKSDRYAMKIVFDEDDQKEMMHWCSVNHKPVYNWYIGKYNTYLTYINNHKKLYKDKVGIKRVTIDKKSNRPMELYLIRKDKTLTIGELCQRGGYKG